MRPPLRAIDPLMRGVSMGMRAVDVIIVSLLFCSPAAEASGSEGIFGAAPGIPPGIPEALPARARLGRASPAAPAEPAWSGPGVAAPPGAASVAARRNIPIRSARWRTALWQLWCSSGRSLPALIGCRGLPAAFAHGARDARPPLLKAP